MTEHINLNFDVTPDGYYELATALEERATGHRIEGNDELADSCEAMAEQARQQAMEQKEDL